MQANQLEAAFSMANRLRYVKDIQSEWRPGDRSAANREATLLQQALQIDPSVTPALAVSIKKTCERMAIPPECLSAFVQSNPEPNAHCFSAGTGRCIISFTSGLVDLLDGEEIEFVAGHEIGHFLLGHGTNSTGSDVSPMEVAAQSRAQEISADRVGLLACQSREAAIRATMKTTSGLTSKHLRFDVGTFLSQARKTSLDDLRTDPFASHPSMLIRGRAMMWLTSLSESFPSRSKLPTKSEMAKIDRRVSKDLATYTDKSAIQKVEKAKINLKMWTAAMIVIDDGRLTKQEQKNLIKFLGKRMGEGLVDYIRQLRKGTVRSTVSDRYQVARGELQGLIPSTFDEAFDEIRTTVLANFDSDTTGARVS